MGIPPELIKLTAKNPKFTNLAVKYGYNINFAEGQIIHLKKVLYRLKHRPRVWQTKLQDLLKDLNYQPLTSDSAVYINPKERLFIITFVNDYIIIGLNKKNIRALTAQLGLKYVIKDQGPASYFLSVEILRDKANRLLYFNQRNYISEVLKHFNFNDSKRIKMPLQPGLIKDVNSEFTALKGVPVEKSDLKLYQQIIRCCIYTITQTRPDITFVMQFLSKSLQQPLSCHLNTAKNLLRYLKGTKDLAINYGAPLTSLISNIIKDIPYNLLLPLKFNNSDFTSNKVTSKSTYGYLFTMSRGPVS